MPYHNTTGKPIFSDAARTKTLQPDDAGNLSAEAAFLLVAPGGTLTDEEAARYGLSANEALTPPSAVEAEQKALAEAMARGAVEEARIRRARIADPQAEEAARKKPAGTKMVGGPPRNKGR
ncbi:MAG TPA: hypothetical protein VG370_35030 [Chloroflexota bacterium]|jgi:hypothetical protein|nr:hypothetical protein [Chloroflexota bacterium]